MLIGVLKEIKAQEYRVGLTPASVRELTARGSKVVIESNAGQGISASDAEYEAAGAEIVKTSAEIFDNAQMIVKVKEPLAIERQQLRPGHILFTYLHLAPDPEQTRDLVESGATCVAYETVTSNTGMLPLLVPMSEIAGRMSMQVAAYFLQRPLGGLGMLLGGVPGVERAKVVVLGGGVVGSHAIDVALGMGADVCAIDRNVDVLRNLWRQFGSTLNTAYASREAIDHHCTKADVVIGSVLVPGAAAPKLVSHDTVRCMKPGSVVVDVAIDQGGCCETSRATTHDRPVYVVEGVCHYCVTNMPGAVPRTSTFALNNSTLPYVISIAEKGCTQALKDDRHLLNGLNVHKGRVTNKPVAEALGYDYLDPMKALVI